MLIELNKIAREVGLSEGEILNLATYAGVPREHGCYDDREILKMLVKHFRETIYGCAAPDYAEKRRAGSSVETRPRVAHTVIRRKRRGKSPWSGNLISR